MAEWIKVEHALPNKEEIDIISNAVGVPHDAVVGKLIRIWVWADQNSADGHGVRVTTSFLDRLSDSPGFADAMRKAGWLEGRDGALSFPRFDRHNGQSSKNRALARDRKTKERGKKCHDTNVTKTRLEGEGEREVVVERERARGTLPKSAEEVRAHGRTLFPPADEGFCDWWWDSMEAMGWCQNGTPVHKWKPLLSKAWSGRRHAQQEKAARSAMAANAPAPKRHEEPI